MDQQMKRWCSTFDSRQFSESKLLNLIKINLFWRLKNHWNLNAIHFYPINYGKINIMLILAQNII